MLVPKYLQEISTTMEASKTSELIKIICKCNHDHFIVYEFCESNHESIKPGFNEIVRENNKLYLVRRNFFGKIVSKVECESMLAKKQRRIIKIKCEKCGQEYIIFDNYLNGYDSVVKQQRNDFLCQEAVVEYKKIHSQSLEIYVMIYQDTSYDEFISEFEYLDHDDYLNSFSNIDIYGKSLKSKKIKICSEETA